MSRMYIMHMLQIHSMDYITLLLYFTVAILVSQSNKLKCWCSVGVYFPFQPGQPIEMALVILNYFSEFPN